MSSEVGTYTYRDLRVGAPEGCCLKVMHSIRAVALVLFPQSAVASSLSFNKINFVKIDHVDVVVPDKVTANKCVDVGVCVEDEQDCQLILSCFTSPNLFSSRGYIYVEMRTVACNAEFMHISSKYYFPGGLRGCCRYLSSLQSILPSQSISHRHKLSPSVSAAGSL